MIDLKSHAEIAGIEIERERPVETLGLLGDPRSGVLAPFYDGGFAPRLIENRGIAMVLTTRELISLVPEDRGVGVCADPLDSFYRLHCHLFVIGHYGPDAASAIASDARIHPTAFVAARNVSIGPGVVIGANAVIEERTIIGEKSVIGPGTVIGAEGFEVRVVNGRRIVVPHGGGVRIGSDVTIQANVAIDRALFGGFTEIADDTVIDNLVHIAHGVAVGKRGRIVAGAFIGGSTIVGDDVWIGPNATVSSSLRVGDRARVTLGAVVTRDVAADGHVSGNFAVDHQRLLAHLRTIR